MNAALHAQARQSHGHVTYDFNQATLPLFLAMAGIPQAQQGICAGLCIAWLDGARNHPMRALRTYASVNPGEAAIQHWANAVIAAGAAWRPVAHGFLAALGMQHQNNVDIHPRVQFPLVINQQAARYNILVAYVPNGASHAMALNRTGQTIRFFDPNEGEAFFGDIGSFGTWFQSFGAATLAGSVGANYRLQLMRYT